MIKSNLLKYELNKSFSDTRKTDCPSTQEFLKIKYETNKTSDPYNLIAVVSMNLDLNWRPAQKVKKGVHAGNKTVVVNTDSILHDSYGNFCAKFDVSDSLELQFIDIRFCSLKLETVLNAHPVESYWLKNKYKGFVFPTFQIHFDESICQENLETEELFFLNKIDTKGGFYFEITQARCIRLVKQKSKTHFFKTSNHVTKKVDDNIYKMYGLDEKNGLEYDFIVKLVDKKKNKILFIARVKN